MGLADHLVSACRHCRFYALEGRRGGHCQQLGVPVKGAWKACSLSSPAFSSPTFAEQWKTLEDIIVWQPHTVELSVTSPDTPTASHPSELQTSPMAESKVA